MSEPIPKNFCRARVIALVDMDCFYVQVEERDDPSIKGIPAAVVQYKAWKGGGIIAVNYEARARGVTRSMRGDDAKSVCPEIVLVRVPEINEKANLTKYRDAGKQVLDVLCEFSTCVERASIDEAYIDLTEAVNEIFVKAGGDHDPVACLHKIDSTHLDNCFPIGFETSSSWLESLKASEMVSVEDVKLAVGAEIVSRMRTAVFDKTGFRCSAGIAHNKILAKLGCGVNKPNKQTVIPHAAVPELYSQTKIKKVRTLGGQFGDILVETYKCELMSDLLKFSLKQLTQDFGDERGAWLYNLARGYEDEPVTKRQLPQSIGCSKNFVGPEGLVTKEKVSFWIGRLCEEVVERIQNDLEVNNRRAKLLTLSVKFQGQKSLSRSCGKNVYYSPDRMTSSVIATMEKLYQQFGILPVNNLGVIASKLENDSGKNSKIDSFYRVAPPAMASVTSFAHTKPSTSSSVSEMELKIPEEKSGKVLDSPNVELITVKPTNIPNEVFSDDDIDVEKCTPDSPITRDSDAETSQDESPQKITRKQHQVNDVVQTGLEKSPTELIQSCIKPENQLKKFFCSTSPTKIRKVISTSSGNNAASSSIVSTLSKQTVQIAKALGSTSCSISEVPTVSSSRESNNQSIRLIRHQSISSAVGLKSKDIDVDESEYIVAGIDTRKLSKEYIQICDRCNKAIPLWEYASHSDFHVAFDLQEKFCSGNIISVGSAIQNNNSIITNASGGSNIAAISGQKRPAVSSNSSRSRGTSKRGRPGRSGSSKEQMKTLDSYFQPKNLR